MVIEIVDIGRIGAVEAKYDPPVSAHGSAPKAGKPALQRMEPPSRHFHVYRPFRRIQLHQNGVDFLDMGWIHATMIVIFVQGTQAAMFEGLDHLLA